MTIDDILKAAKQAGLRDEKAIRALVRPAAELQPGTPGKPGAHVGSKIGGLPSLPSPGDWPTHDGAPLAFLAQIDLADAPPAIAADLPREGLLSFFYACDDSTWGFDPKDAGKSAVRWFPDAKSARPPGAWPKDLAEERRFQEVPVRLHGTPVLAPSESPLLDTALPRKEDREAYGNLMETLMADQSWAARSLLLGHAEQIQGDMSEECSLVTAGIYCGDATASKHPRYEELAAKALDWRLLFQLHSVEEAGMCWGDLGCLYFWIRDEDLRAKRFNAAWMILQCS